MDKRDMQAPAVLEARDLDAGYAGVPVVHGVTVAVQAGHVVTLIGPNGAGKSTLLKTLAGQLDALGGAVLLSGRDLAAIPVRERARELSVLLTDRVRTELLTCADVVESGRYPHTGRMGLLTEDDLRKVRAAMELTSVWDLRGADFMQLSDGQRQRVMLARALAQDPRALVLDEPTNHLDVRYQIELLNLLRTLARERGLAIVMTLHELPLAYRASDWLVCVKDGRVMDQGTPERIFCPEVIDALFDLEPGTFDALTGDVVLAVDQRDGCFDPRYPNAPNAQAGGGNA